MSRQSDKDLANLYLYYYVGLYPQDGDAINKAVKIIEIVGATHGEKPHKDYQGEFLDVPCTTMEINASDASIYDPEHIYQVYWRGIGPSPIRWKNGYLYNREEIERKVAELQEELTNKSSVNSSREKKVSNMSNKKLNSSEQSTLTTQDIYDEVEEYVRDKVFAAVLDVQDTCQRNVIMQAVPEYDPEWCAEEWTDEDDDKQLEACTALLDLIMSGLFRHANLRD